VSSARILTGHVAEFDGAVGLGVVGGDDGGRYPFHCVEIADGSRNIDVDMPVAFLLLTKLGRSEAAAVTVRA